MTAFVGVILQSYLFCRELEGKVQSFPDVRVCQVCLEGTLKWNKRSIERELALGFRIFTQAVKRKRFKKLPIQSLRDLGCACIHTKINQMNVNYKCSDIDTYILSNIMTMCSIWSFDLTSKFSSPTQPHRFLAAIVRTFYQGVFQQYPQMCSENDGNLLTWFLTSGWNFRCKWNQMDGSLWETESSYVQVNGIPTN